VSMSKISLNSISARTAALCNVPLFIIPLVMLLFWHLGAYSNGDGYPVSSIVGGIVGIYILPSLAISSFLLRRASRERKNRPNHAAKVSAIYGISASMYLGIWFLLMEPTW
jgi:membrane protein implicated in regulation of membrane protease activity